MKIFSLKILIGTFFFPPVLFAGPMTQKIRAALEQLPTCGNFIRYDDTNVYTGFGPYWTSHTQPRVPAPGKMWVYPLNGKSHIELKTLDSVIDLITVDSTAYVLTYSGIEMWDLRQRERLRVIRTYNTSAPFDNEQHPQAFAKFENKLILAHGRLGVSFLDLNNGKITNQYILADHQGGLESMAKGVTISGKYAYIVLDSYTLVEKNEKPPFRGIVVIDLESEKVVSELDGIPPGADSVTSYEDKVIVSFYGQPLWKYSASSLLSTDLPSPLKRVWKFPVEGHPTGKAALDDTYYYTCFSKMPGPGEGPYFKKVPIALDRNGMKLD